MGTEHFHQLAIGEVNDSSTDVNAEYEQELLDLLNSNRPLIASYAAVRMVVKQGGYATLVWAGEGKFKSKGKNKSKQFVFNAEHRGLQPMLLDGLSANAIVKVHDGLEDNPEMQARMEQELAESRFKFLKWHDICFKCVKIGG